MGIFGTYAFLNNPLINSQAAVLANGVTSPDLLSQTYLRVVNQAGASFSAGLWGNNYVEGNVGYLKSAVYGDRAGATMRFVFPLNNKIAFSVEGDLNPTILGPSNDGRAVVGVIFGNSLRPKEFLAQDRPIPVDVPRVRYELITKTVRIGHTAPVADAGPDQIGVPAGPITLNASASYSPDGLPIAFHWIEDGGPAVSLTSPNSCDYLIPSDTGTILRLPRGGHRQLWSWPRHGARVRVTTSASSTVGIDFFFIANPSTIAAGASSTLSWKVENATTINISGIGSVAASGSAPVSPSATTTYTLTASNANSSQSATATVVVSGSTTQVVSCYASPSNIILGESATLFYTTTNANSVTVNPGNLTEGANGSVVVTPTASTTYTILASGPNNATASTSCSAAVTVTNGQLPRIIQFSSSPQNISAGQNSTLLWVVENATSVTINNGIGSVSLGGTQAVSPAATTTYTLTATNAAGNVTSQTTVNVGAAVSITSFTANPNPSPAAGAAVVLTCTAARMRPR